MSVDLELRRMADDDDSGGRVTVQNGTVKTVTAGAAADGNAAVIVTVGGDDLLAPYLESYSPAVGHLVRVEFVDGSPCIVGRVIGLPNF